MMRQRLANRLYPPIKEHSPAVKTAGIGRTKVEGGRHDTRLAGFGEKATVCIRLPLARESTVVILRAIMSVPLTPDPRPKIVITAQDGASAEVHLHGAHVTSWKPAGKDEQLFLSTRSEFGEGAAIRGGVPVIFPQFSLLGPLPRHGFVRNTAWEVLRENRDEVTLTFKDTVATRDIWPHPFRLELSVRVEESRLEMKLHVFNTGDAPFEFAGALHTYLRVQDIAQTTVEGLQGLTFRDANTMVEHPERPARIEFGKEVDRLYYDALPRTIVLRDGQHSLTVNASGFPDAVVWNPGEVKSDKMADMEAGGWKRFICIEAAAAHENIALLPGEEWVGMQVLTLG